SAARTFADYNHDVLDSPKLQIVFGDGRNYLLTTRDRFDVITADPVHPWTRGSAYLYTQEYYRLAAARLAPGGVMAQWLPIYELTPKDVATVVRTFQQAFAHTALWLTQYDAELIGSNAPLRIDEDALARRLEDPTIAADLERVEMGSPEDFLSYFVAGSEGLRRFARSGVVNTDDNLHLEFSAPRSIGVGNVMGDNVQALTRHREHLESYMTPLADADLRAARRARWERNLQAARIYDEAHARYLWGQSSSNEFRTLLGMLKTEQPEYAPGRFLQDAVAGQRLLAPKLVASESFALLTAEGGTRSVQISAVDVRVGRSRGKIVFVDNAARNVYGQRYRDGSRAELDVALPAFATEVLAALRSAYEEQAAAAASRGLELPPAEDTLAHLRAVVVARTTEEP
ncbi:MAG TPA: spermidine synthase, partial [Myxococcota bacterium]